MIYIYELIDPITGKVRYIGRTTNLSIRYKGHINKSKKLKTHKDYWIQNLVKNGFKPIMREIDCLKCSWEKSHIIEREYIKDYISKGCDLTNHDDKGISGKNKIISKEQRKKISKTVKMRHKEGVLTCGRKPVDLYDLNAKFIKSFKSMKECSEYIKVSEKHLQSYFKRGDKKIKKYIAVRDGSVPSPWKYKKRDNKSKIKVIYEGVVYESLKDASKASGYAANSISYHINGKVKAQKFFKLE